MSASVSHVFYDVFMGWSHASLSELLKKKVKKDLQKGELAIFVNKAWTGVKVLAPGGALIYLRTSTPFRVEQLRYLPAMFGNGRFSFSGNLESGMIKAFEAKFGKQMKRMKVAYG